MNIQDFEKFCGNYGLKYSDILSLKEIFCDLLLNDYLFRCFLFDYDADEYHEKIKKLKIVVSRTLVPTRSDQSDYKDFLHTLRSQYMSSCQMNIKELLISQGISRKVVNDIVQNRKYSDPLLDVLENLKKNPYYIIELPLSECDNISKNNNITVEEVDFILSKITRTIYNLFKKGYTSISDNLIGKKYGEYEISDIKKSELIGPYGIIVYNSRFYLKHIYECETQIVKSISNAKVVVDNNIFNILDKIAKRGILFDEQFNILQNLLTQPISIISGHAGSGKSTLLVVLSDLLVAHGYKPLILSFTGKTIVRIKELINKLDFIANKKQLSEKTMTLNKAIASNIKPFDFVIIDEISNINIELLGDFFREYDVEEKQIVLFGDTNQLKPIRPGNCFSELIKSQLFPVYTLKQSHRNNQIIKDNAEAILLREKLMHDEKFRILNNDDYISEIFKYYDANNTIIIVPYNNDAKTINKEIQEKFNPVTHDDSYTEGKYVVLKNQDKIVEIKFNNICWRINDKVMMLDNNYQYNIMNGEEGLIRSITKLKGHYYLDVVFDDVEKEKICQYRVCYPSSSTYKSNIPTVFYIIHSYAITVHKSQGSEWNKVIIYLNDSCDNRFVTKSLLYTAITRAKEKCIIIDQADFIKSMKYGDDQDIEENLAHRLISNKKAADNLMVLRLCDILELKEFGLALGISDLDNAEDKDDIIFRIINHMIDNDYDFDDLL